jgi:glycosyltransferase involved in cell wall biosynthesis
MLSDLQKVASVAQAPSAYDGRRVVLIHDWLTGMRGGERVLEVLCALFPQAPLFTLLHVPGSISDIIENRAITTSPLQRMPMASQKYRYYLPLFPAFAEMTKVRNCDLAISTSHAVAKAMVGAGRSRPFHVCYIHSPMRYVWDRFDDYFGQDRVGVLSSRFFFRPIAKGLQVYDQRTNARVDVFIANSRFVAERVRKLYNRKAEVLPPPIDLERFGGLARQPEDWYLVVAAFVPYKRVDHAIAACASLGRSLKIAGCGPEANKLAALGRDLGANVEFLGFLSDQDLASYYSRARALLFPGIEDFGMVPVEAMAAGCPVIALGKGGILDSMTASTGVLYYEETVEGLKNAIADFESRFFDSMEIRKRSTAFSKPTFVNGFNAILDLAMF